MGPSAQCSKPNGIRANTASAHGMIHRSVSGTATMLATSP
jgi:hypothetical protein